jgi:hypothetical protein
MVRFEQDISDTTGKYRVTSRVTRRTLSDGTDDGRRDAREQCPGLPLRKFDADGNGVLSHEEAHSLATTLPARVDGAPTAMGCTCAPQERTSSCFRIAGDDHELEVGSEYDQWLKCVFGSMSERCIEFICAS